MRSTSARSAPLASPYYYERLGILQHALRDSEKKRLELEKKLYEYNQSDICRVKLKYVKLKKYLKEICESEKKAHTRNQEYLKQFERVQAHVGHFTTNTETLKELKGVLPTIPCGTRGIELAILWLRAHVGIEPAAFGVRSTKLQTPEPPGRPSFGFLSGWYFKASFL
ncbi:kizuna centrosomal protein [Rhinolophus ferrumequinum]|uniref:Centrosomal protein kizuna n=1 Tax=Rhinolophus ferrumequinum TaxID=59479 RepID=A0A7J7S7S2_RHIFE|nr:kizuna centrosomal protein [Rhinolophus ferrumequinum]